MRYVLHYLLLAVVAGVLTYAALAALSGASDAVRAVAAGGCGLAAAILTNWLFPLDGLSKA